jgi:hypothetical protein
MNDKEQPDKGQGQLHFTALEAAFARGGMRKQAAEREREAKDRKRAELQDRANRATIHQLPRVTERLRKIEKNLAPARSNKFTSINEKALRKFVLPLRRNEKEWPEIKQLASSRFPWLRKLKGENLAKLWRRVQNTTRRTLSRQRQG